MTIVFKPVPFGASRRQGQHRIKAVQSLNGGLLIHAEHRRVLRRIHVQTNDVGRLLLKQRVVGSHVAIQPMRLETRLRPYSLHRGLTHPQRLGHLPARPMRRTVGWLLLCLAGDPGLCGRIRNTRLAAFVPRIQTLDSVFFKTPLPARNSGSRRLQRLHDAAIAGAVHQSENQPRSEYVTSRQRAGRCPRTQLAPLFLCNRQHCLMPSHNYQTDQNS